MSLSAPAMWFGPSSVRIVALERASFGYLDSAAVFAARKGQKRAWGYLLKRQTTRCLGFGCSGSDSG